jgi:peroxiredoxin
VDVVTLVGRIALAATFLLAAVGKLADRNGTREAVRRFGGPAGLAAPIGVTLAIAEVVIAVGLIIPRTSVGAAVAAAGLLVIFVVAIARLLVRGEAPDCHCFGRLGTAQVGRRTIVRNALLLATAAFVAVGGRHGHRIDPAAWVADHPVSVLLGAAVLLNLGFGWQLFRQNGRLLARVAALEAGRAPDATAGDPGSALAEGTVAPAFELTALDGRTVSLAEVLAPGDGALLVFTDPACAHCEPVLSALGAGYDGPPLVVITSGAAQDNRARAQHHGLQLVLVQEDFEVADAYRVYGLPGAVHVDRQGRIAAGRAQGTAEVLGLAEAMSRPRLELTHVAGGIR